MKLILDSENSHPTTITVKGKEITLLLIESSILIDSSQIAKIFDKKEKTVATKVQKSKLEKYETDNVKILELWIDASRCNQAKTFLRFKADAGRTSLLLF